MIKQMEGNNIEINNSISTIAKGVIIAIITSMALLFIFSAILTYTNIPESTSNPVIIIISAISILIASQLSTRKIKKNGIVNGGIIGGIYIIFLYIISSIISGNFSLGLNAIIMIVVSIVAGMFGRNNRSKYKINIENQNSCTNLCMSFFCSIKKYKN